MKTRTWIIIIASIFAGALVLTICLRSFGSGTVANVYRDNELIWSVDLSKVTEGYDKVFTSEDGHKNVVRVETGRIRMLSADCPDKVCVNTGWISKPGTPVVCLPERLVIRIEGSGQTDSVAR